MLSRITLLCCALLSALQMPAQIRSESIRAIVNDQKLYELSLKCADDVKQFYTLNNFQTCWLLADQKKSNLQFLNGYVQQSEWLGLRKTDYYPDLFQNTEYPALAPGNATDSLITEIKYTDGAICFFHDLLTGNKPEMLLYNGLNYSPSCSEIVPLLVEYLNQNRFGELLNDIEPGDAIYLAIKKRMNFFQEIMAEQNFADAFITSQEIDSSNTQLITRLYQLGFIPASHPGLSQALLKQKIMAAQEFFNLPNDSALKSQLMHALNIPLANRVSALSAALNAQRWLTYIKKKSPHIITANIPSASLMLSENEKNILYSRIIVGKRSTPTPTLLAQITQVILYPYWYVPYKIATKELLPSIKENIRFLEENNFQVLDKNGRICDPSKINWQKLNRNNFPYTIRQSTGCDNSLGIIKLNLNSPYDVYLHDTPWKVLFKLNNRYFSHGCIRVEKAAEIARFVLKDNTSAIDTIEEKSCLKNQGPLVINASEKIPVIVLYHTAWTDSANQVHFYTDIYNKEQATTNKMNTGIGRIYNL